ncbi:SCO family protein [Sphingomonas panacisoli]|uniref:SCO family protein n=1 Tax=Sphingomonas panacisoli TaxID=1813879 RepID=A0A5B8LDL2_9SPHN|nr:SCO family protein [Sphingomonas panacisoli]QDZ06258.1 SCO family protein [Sphingomonas panacisoli]
MNFSRFVILLSLSAAACSSTPATPPPLEGARIGGPFSLTDQDGKPVTDRSFAGKYRIMYFGYTFCPDICPTTAQTIGAAMRALDKSDPDVSAKVVPVFVTVDPERDTPKVVGQFVHAFYPRFVGLTGSVAAIDKVRKAYGVSASKEKPNAEGGYLVGHSNAAYLMDPDNKPIALLPTDQGADATADEIKRWVK